MALLNLIGVPACNTPVHFCRYWMHCRCSRRFGTILFVIAATLILNLLLTNTNKPACINNDCSPTNDEIERPRDEKLEPRDHQVTESFHTQSGQQALTDDVESCVLDYLATHEDYCRRFLIPKVSNIRYSEFLLPGLHRVNKSALCPCLPATLVGSINPDPDAPFIGRMVERFRDVEAGGRWSPSWCGARHRIAVIVPYSDRETQLRTFLLHFHTMLQRQLIDYNIFVIEQVQPEVFNRAALMNIGFMETAAMADFDCFIFHDVDQYPIDDRNIYTCSRDVRHLVAYREKLNYSLAYDTHFGGGNAFSKYQFVQTNGFSNQFYGWGGEDDDLYKRVNASGLAIVRNPRCVARYKSVDHVKQSVQTKQKLNGYEFRRDFSTKDGLNTLKYIKLLTQKHVLYTKILVTLPDAT